MRSRRGRKQVHPTTMNSSWDTVMFGIPLIALLIFGYFRLDEIFEPRKPSAGIRRHTHPVKDPAEQSLLTDPDGRPWD